MIVEPLYKTCKWNRYIHIFRVKKMGIIYPCLFIDLKSSIVEVSDWKLSMKISENGGETFQVYQDLGCINDVKGPGWYSLGCLGWSCSKFRWPNISNPYHLRIDQKTSNNYIQTYMIYHSTKNCPKK